MSFLCNPCAKEGVFLQGADSHTLSDRRKAFLADELSHLIGVFKDDWKFISTTFLSLKNYTLFVYIYIYTYVFYKYVYVYVCILMRS